MFTLSVKGTLKLDAPLGFGYDMVSVTVKYGSVKVCLPRSIFNIVMPITKIMRAAISSKMPIQRGGELTSHKKNYVAVKAPSQSSSDLDHRSAALVNQTAMNL